MSRYLGELARAQSHCGRSALSNRIVTLSDRISLFAFCRTMAQDVSTSQLNHCLWTDEAIKHVGLASDKICVTGYFDRAAVEARIRERELENERLRALNEQLRRLMNA